MLGCRRPVILDRHSVGLPSERERLSGTRWILIQMGWGVCWLVWLLSYVFSEDCFCCCPETALWCVSAWRTDCRCDSNSKRSHIDVSLQLNADIDYTSSVPGFWKADLFAIWSLLGEIYFSAISPVLLQEDFGYLWCSSGHRQCWSDGIGKGS